MPPFAPPLHSPRSCRLVPRLPPIHRSAAFGPPGAGQRNTPGCGYAEPLHSRWASPRRAPRVRRLRTRRDQRASASPRFSLASTRALTACLSSDKILQTFGTHPPRTPSTGSAALATTTQPLVAGDLTAASNAVQPHGRRERGGRTLPPYGQFESPSGQLPRRRWRRPSCATARRLKRLRLGDFSFQAKAAARVTGAAVVLLSSRMDSSALLVC